MVEVASGVLMADTPEGIEYLMLQKESATGTPYMDYVGGKIEEDEAPEEAFLREFYEETDTDPGSLLELSRFQPVEIVWGRDSYTVHPHEVKIGSRFEPMISEEHEGYEWMNRSEIDRYHAAGILSDGRMKTLAAVESTEGRYERLVSSFDSEQIDQMVDRLQLR